MNVIYLICCICILIMFYILIGKTIVNEVYTSTEAEKRIVLVFWPLIVIIFIILIILTLLYIVIYEILYGLYYIFKQLKKYVSK